MSEIDLMAAPRYQSSLRVRGLQVTEAMLEGDPGFEMEVDGKRLAGVAGDFIVLMPDGRHEVWSREQFEREFEPEKSPRRLTAKTGAAS